MYTSGEVPMTIVKRVPNPSFLLASLGLEVQIESREDDVNHRFVASRLCFCLYVRQEGVLIDSNGHNFRSN